MGRHDFQMRLWDPPKTDGHFAKDSWQWADRTFSDGSKTATKSLFYVEYICCFGVRILDLESNLLIRVIVQYPIMGLTYLGVIRCCYFFAPMNLLNDGSFDPRISSHLNSILILIFNIRPNAPLSWKNPVIGFDLISTHTEYRRTNTSYFLSDQLHDICTISLPALIFVCTCKCIYQYFFT